MAKRKIDSNPFGLFPDAGGRSLEENLFHLCMLYNILFKNLLKECGDQLPEEQKEKFESAHKRLNDQRQAYIQSAKE